jgi:hypothetical protein
MLKQERPKLFEKVESRAKCAACVGGLMDLCYEWI